MTTPARTELLQGQVIAWTRHHPLDAVPIQTLRDAGAEVHVVALTTQAAVACVDFSERLVPGAHTDLVFTSAKAVGFFAERLERHGLVRDPAQRVWAVGPVTAAAIHESLGSPPTCVPKVASAEGLVALASELRVAGARFLFPAARQASSVLEEGLGALGAEVLRLEIYETRSAAHGVAELCALAERLSLAVLASPSAVDALLEAWRAGNRAVASLPVAVVGHTTAAHARKLGFKVVVMPPAPTLVGLAHEVVHRAQQAHEVPDALS